MRIVRGVVGVVAVASMLIGVLVVPTAGAAPADLRTYRVTVANLTSGQPLTPVLFAAHRASADVFTVGTPASFGVKEIAENGNLAPLAEALEAAGGVSEVFVGGMPIVPEGLPGSAMFPDSVSFEISAELGAHRLSWVSMLICTNDGFTGLDSIKLPGHVGAEVAALTAGYDAGTETNTEDFADIVPPCQALVGVTSGDPGTGTSNPALAEGGVIHHHQGIVGGADLLPEVHSWDVDAPVAEVTVERIA